MTSYDDADEALADLRHHWGDAYSIMHGRDGWQAKRRDGRGEWIIRPSADELLDAIGRDYIKRPVPRDEPMSDVVRALLDDGYRVGFSKDPEGYVATVDDHDAIAASPAAALAAVAEIVRERS